MTDERQRRSPIAIILACIFGAIVLYVLSAGPAMRVAVRIVDTGGRVPRAFLQVYGPLIWLEKNTVLKQPLGWYFELWFPPEERSN